VRSAHLTSIASPKAAFGSRIFTTPRAVVPAARVCSLDCMRTRRAWAAWSTRDRCRDTAGDLNRNCVTIAEVLRTGGLQTMASGKWRRAGDGVQTQLAAAARLDRYYGIIHGSASYFQPPCWCATTRRSPPTARFLPDRWHRHARRIYRRLRASPIRSSSTCPSPRRTGRCTPSRRYARYKGRAHRAGMRCAERQQRMIRMGLVDKRWGLTPRDREVPAWKDVTDKAWQRRRMEVYGEDRPHGSERGSYSGRPARQRERRTTP
jgi:arylsulfatase A-like enzyme